ncbi:hypothetical protein FACS1894120_0850 [Clostridia bacterium]|nr:hypothetical protein FACS1894120_0850 [Clostridia bacterium]
MLNFRKLTPADRDDVNRLLAVTKYRGCEYTFGNNVAWQDIYDMEACFFEGLYILRNKSGFFFPAGEIDDTKMLKRAFAEMTAYCRDKWDKPLTFFTMDAGGRSILTEIYGDRAVFDTNRDFSDYLYSAESLRTLSGKKLHSKRNHVNRFKDNAYLFEPITADNLDECRAMGELWCRENECELDPDKYEEICAVRRGMRNFFELGFIGGLIRVGGSVEAFTYGEMIPAGDTFVTHVEKAFTRLQGTYPAVNFEFANYLDGLYGGALKYINREEDTGAENLRKAKLSYRPEFLLEKFSAVISD